jgi:hypothetical protein
MKKLFLSIFAIMTLMSVQSVVSADYSDAISQGLSYLQSQQDAANGQIMGFGGESDWAAIAFGANGVDVANIKQEEASLYDYLIADQPTPSSAATIWERKILAIVAIGEDPSDFGGTNFVENLENLYSDNQIGDPILLNDDIFGILALIASGPLANQEILADSVDFVISHQDESGGFSWTTESCIWCGSDSNDTSAAIQALKAAQDQGLTHSELETALENAQQYLLSTQKEEGGFGYDLYSDADGSSTAWALMALNSLELNDSPEATRAAAWLIANQNPDGGFHYQSGFGSDTSTTSHAVIAMSGKSWILDIFDPNANPTPSPSPNPTAAPTPISTPTPSPSPTPEPTPTPTPSPTVINNNSYLTNVIEGPNIDHENTGSVLGDHDTISSQSSVIEDVGFDSDDPSLKPQNQDLDTQTKNNHESAILLTLMSLGGIIILAIGLRVWENRKRK